MAKKIKSKPVEREYIINVRRQILRVPRHKRTPKAVKTIKQFIAKHMRVPNRDLKNVKLDKWLNHELWFRGIKNPITKVKVKAYYEDKVVRVELAEIPEAIKYLVAKEKKKEQKAKETKEKTKEKKEETKKTTEKDDSKEKESEKEKSVEEAEQKIYQKEAKQAKHVESGKQQKVQPIRKALKK